MPQYPYPRINMSKYRYDKRSRPEKMLRDVPEDEEEGWKKLASFRTTPELLYGLKFFWICGDRLNGVVLFPVRYPKA